MRSEHDLLGQLAQMDLSDDAKRRIVAKLRRRGLATAESVPMLTELASSPDRFLSRNALTTLAAVGTPEAVRAIERGLRHPDGYTMMQAAKLLKRLEAWDAVPEMIRVLRERTGDLERISEKSLACYLCSMLRRRPNPNAVDAIAGYVNDPDGVVRTSCVWALGAIGTPEALAALELAAPNADRTTRKKIESARAGTFPRFANEDRSAFLVSDERANEVPRS
jgi:HEAT repeat protein